MKLSSKETSAEYGKQLPVEMDPLIAKEEIILAFATCRENLLEL
jgi:hypothetical protein